MRNNINESPVINPRNNDAPSIKGQACSLLDNLEQDLNDNERTRSREAD